MNNSTSKIELKAVLFDLDGTLVDTARDFVRIIKEIAEKYQLATPDEDVIRQRVSAGSLAMVSVFSTDKSLNIDSPHREVLNTEDKQSKNDILLAYKQEFLAEYDANICVNSRLYKGFTQLLKQLAENNIPWGVVTNKPRYLSEKLLSALDLDNQCAVLVCPEDVTHSKPNPEPMYLAMKQLNIAKSDAHKIIYVGDHIRDIQAGNSAGMITVTASYGYLSPTDYHSIHDWQANYIVDSSEELVILLQDKFKFGVKKG